MNIGSVFIWIITCTGNVQAGFEAVKTLSVTRNSAWCLLLGHMSSHALKARNTASVLNELLLLRLDDGTLPPMIHEVMPRINATRGFIRSHDIIPATVGTIPMPDGSLVILTALVVCDTGSLLAVVATTPKDYHYQLLIDTYQAFCNRRGLGSSSNLKFQVKMIRTAGGCTCIAVDIQRLA
jgi:hypothetical protein